MSPDEDAAPITAVPIPSDDFVFALRVRDELRNLDRLPVGEAASTLQARLRRIHPDAHTSLRSAMASYGAARVIYVYRDGWERRISEDDWTTDPGTARVVTDPAGTYLEANDAAATLFGVDRLEIIGRAAGSFTHADALVGDAAELWRTLETVGRLHSLAIVAQAGGTEEVVEFVTIKDGDGAGRNVTFLRAAIR